MRDDGSGVTRLASHAFSPHWTPDSKTIVFLRGTEGEAGVVYTVAAGGGKPRRLARVLADYIADVASDGHSVLLGPGRVGLAVVSIDDGMVRRLTPDGGSGRRASGKPFCDDRPHIFEERGQSS